MEAVRDVERLAAHVLLETASVLTRLPSGLAQPLDLVRELLDDAFPGALLVLPATAYRPLLASLDQAGLRGGAVFDGLIGATAAHHGARLVSLDRRAAPTYRAVGARVELLACGPAKK